MKYRTCLHVRTLVACLVAVLLSHPSRADEPAPCDRAATTILVVRHAEKPGQADSLSAAGFARAKTLAHVAGRANVRAVYHSDTRRTLLTAQPLARQLGITPVVYPAKDYDALVARIFAEHEGETVLVVGHSNTVTKIVAALGGPALDDLAENEFDKLFIVTTQPCRRGPATLIELEYGVPTPWSSASEQPNSRAPVVETAALPSIELPAELARVLTDYEAGWGAKDEAALAALFTEDGFVLPGGRAPVRGRAAIQAHYKGSGGPLSLRALAYGIDGNTGYIIGAYAGAKGAPDDGKFTLTLRKENDRWLIMSDMDNSNRR